MSSPPPAGAPAPLVAEVVVRYGDRVVDVRHISGDRYVIGEGPQAHLPVQLPAGVDRAGIPLIIALADQAVLGLVPGMTGALVRGDETVQLADLADQGRRSYGLRRGDRCELQLGALRFEIATVEPADYAPARRPLDRLYWLSNAASLLLIGGLVLLGEPRPPGELALEEVTASRERAVRYLSELPPPPPEPPRPPPPTVSVQKTRPAARPAPPPPEPEPLLEVPAAPGEVPTAPKATRRGIADRYSYARTAGFLDEEFTQANGKLLADAQVGALAYQNDAADQAFWTGVAKAPPRGPKFGGLELAETERGGGTHGERKPPKAPGKAVSVDTTPTARSAEEIAEARRTVTVLFSQPSVTGELDPDNVLRALRKQQGGLARCYKDATVGTDAEGQVMLRLKVDASGRVTAATLEHGSSGVAGIGPCLTSAARAWKFTAPLDGKPLTIVVEAALSSRRY